MNDSGLKLARVHIHLPCLQIAHFLHLMK